MALGTAEHRPNPQMPAPGEAHTDAPAEFDKEQVIDPVHLLRLYGDKAQSLEEMRALAMKAAAETQAAAAEARANKDVPISEMDQGLRPAPPAQQERAQRHPEQSHREA